MTNIFSLSCSRIFALALLLAIPGKDALGQQLEQASAGASAQPAAKVPAIPDVTVLDQDNRKLHFYTDLVQGKTVAINFIFTTCTTICPPLTANFAKIQKTMLARGETGLQLISVSVDPQNDTPERLKSYAALFRAKPGWAFVTGERADLEKIWKAFNINLSSKQDHPPTVAIGNEPQRVWVYASGLTTADKLMGAITPVLGEKKSAPLANTEAAKSPGSKLP
ncbi:MAG: SCO family protein [Terriglobales bacterium]